MSLNQTLLAGMAAIAISVSAPLSIAIAQDAAPAAPRVETPVAATPALDEEKLKAFAAVFLEVTAVTQKYQPQIEAAGSVEEQQKIQQEAGKEIVAVVNAAEGISVEEYNLIIQSAQSDPDLAQRINDHINAAAAAPLPPATATQQ